MCLMLYLGTDRTIPIRKSEGLSIELPHERAAGVEKTTAKPYCYFVGSYTGCSCGFPHVLAETHIEYFDGMFDEDDESRRLDLASTDELFEVLRYATELGDSCALFPARSGSEREPPKGDVLLSLGTMSPDTFVMTEQFRYLVSK